MSELTDDNVRLIREALAEPLPEEDRPDDPKIKYVVRLHRAIEAMDGKSLALAKRIGKVLDPIRKREKNAGKWGAWVEANLPFCVRTANRYVAVAGNAELYADDQDKQPETLIDAYLEYGLVTEPNERKKSKRVQHIKRGKKLDRDVLPLARVLVSLHDYRQTIKDGKVFLDGDAAQCRKVVKGCLNFIAKIETEIAALRERISEADKALRATPKGKQL